MLLSTPINSPASVGVALVVFLLIAAVIYTGLHAFSKKDYKPKDMPVEPEHEPNYHEPDIKNFYELDDNYTT